MAAFCNIGDLQPGREICKINVQIIRLWTKYLAAGRNTIEMVLCDSMGNKIHACVGVDLVGQYGHALKEGYWKIIENFSIVSARDAIRTTKHAFKIKFKDNTRVRVEDFLPRPLTGFQPVPYCAIKDGLLATDCLVDVIGQIVRASLLDIVSLNGKDTEKITLELRDKDDHRLTVHIWGKDAQHVSKVIHNPHFNKSVVCVIRFGKIDANRDRSVSNAYYITDVKINPDSMEVQEFSKLLPQKVLDVGLLDSKQFNLTTDIFDKYQFFVTTPVKSITEVVQTQQIQRCIVRCTIAAIDYDIGWYYLSCKICRHKLLTVPMDKNVYGSRSTHALRNYYCAKCKSDNPDPLPRYNIHLVVLDNTSNTKFLLPDRVAEKLLQIPCVNLAGLLTDQIEDPIEVHKVLSTLVGESYFFKIGIESDNLHFNSKTFNVVELLPNEYMIDFHNPNGQPMGTPSSICSKFLAWIDCCHQSPESEQIHYTDLKTKFIYDSKDKSWKKNTNKRKMKSPSHANKVYKYPKSV